MYMSVYVCVNVTERVKMAVCLSVQEIKEPSAIFMSRADV